MRLKIRHLVLVWNKTHYSFLSDKLKLCLTHFLYIFILSMNSEGYHSPVIGWHWDEMWGKSVLIPDWSRWRGNDSCVASCLTSHWWRLQREKREIISTSVRFGEGRTRYSAAKWTIFFLKSFTNRGRQISGLMFERLGLSSAVFMTRVDSGLCNAADYQIPGETWPPNIWHETRKLNRGRFYSPDKTIRRQYSLSWCLFQRRFYFWLDKNNQLSGDGYDNGRWDVGEWLMLIMIAARELWS